MKKCISILLAFNISLAAIHAQDKILNKSELAEAEFHTAINPLDTNNIVLVTMHGFDSVEDSDLTIYYTRDFGDTWSKSTFDGTIAGELGAGDPVVAFNAEGKLILACLIIDADSDIYTSLSESLDGGETWERKFKYEKEQTDKPWLVIDNSSDSPHKGNIYVPVAEDDLILLSWDENYNLLDDGSVPSSGHLPSAVVDKAGELYLSTTILDDPNVVNFQHYTDGGATHVHTSTIAVFPDYTFNGTGISERFNPSPYLAIDNSDGPYSGRIYLSYCGSEDLYEYIFNIFLTYSDDQGRTWSTPKIVNADDSPGVQQFYSSIFVNNEGTLLIDWYDRTNDSSPDLLTDFMLGISNDGGETFTQIQLTSEPMNFNFVIEAGSYFGVGDYHQLVATDNTAFSFWSDGRTNDGDMNIYYAKVDLARMSSSVKEQGLVTDKIKITKIFPVPAQDNLTVELELEKSYELKYQILNIMGRVVLEKPSENYSSGTQQITLPMNLASGEYVLAITGDDAYYNHIKFVVE